MSYLQDLRVKKVSFVKRGANKRQFFLAKSADFVEDFSNSTNNNNLGGLHKMRPEIKTKLGELLKTDRDYTKIANLLKEDPVLKATEDELAEVKNVVEFMPPLPVVVKEEKPESKDNAAALLVKAQADAKKSEEEKKALELRLSKIEADTHKKDVAEWVEKECPYLNMTTEEAVNQLIKSEVAGAETVEILKQSFKSTSDALRISKLTKELGRSGEEGLDPVGGNVVAEVIKKTQNLRKTDQNEKSSELIRSAIHGLGAVRYENYRKEFNRRARTY